MSDPLKILEKFTSAIGFDPNGGLSRMDIPALAAAHAAAQELLNEQREARQSRIDQLTQVRADAEGKLRILAKTVPGIARMPEVADWALGVQEYNALAMRLLEEANFARDLSESETTKTKQNKTGKKDRDLK